MVWRYWGIFGPKKTCNENWQNSQVFMRNFLSHYILLTSTKSTFTTSHLLTSHLLSPNLCSKSWFCLFFLIFCLAHPILIFEDLQLSRLYSLSVILYKLKQKSKKAALIRPKVKMIFLQLDKKTVLTKEKIKIVFS